MLSSTADHLYWMARYVERAENTARILDVTSRMALLPAGVQNRNQEWEAPLILTGLYDKFCARFNEIDANNVQRYMALDTENPSSISECWKSARENARAVRGTVTSEMWESLNATWLEMREIGAERLEGAGAREFFDWVKERSHLFRGVTFGTILHDEAFHFIRLGTFLERADNTARILDVKYHILLPSVKAVGGAADYYQWGALLRSVSAFSAYRKIYRNVIKPRQVAELLILREDMPRSLHACLNEIHQILRAINGDAGREARRLAGDLHARLHYGRIEDVFQQGLHQYLTDFLSRINTLGAEITRAFLWPENALQFQNQTQTQTQNQTQAQSQGQTQLVDLARKLSN
jgi:uncharacterized alpha-E superfamily protein